MKYIRNNIVGILMILTTALWLHAALAMNMWTALIGTVLALFSMLLDRKLHPEEYKDEYDE